MYQKQNFKPRASAIILKGDKILLMHRIIHEKDYYILPGGGIEDQESPEQAVIREVKEETNFDTTKVKRLFTFQDHNNNRYHNVFKILQYKGIMQLGGPESKKHCQENQFLLEWHNLDSLDKINLCPQDLNKLLEQYLN